MLQFLLDGTGLPDLNYLNKPNSSKLSPIEQEQSVFPPQWQSWHTEEKNEYNRNQPSNFYKAITMKEQ